MFEELTKLKFIIDTYPIPISKRGKPYMKFRVYKKGYTGTLTPPKEMDIKDKILLETMQHPKPCLIVAIEMSKVLQNQTQAIKEMRERIKTKLAKRGEIFDEENKE